MELAPAYAGEQGHGFMSVPVGIEWPAPALRDCRAKSRRRPSHPRTSSLRSQSPI